MPTKHCQKYFVIVLGKLGTINACLYAHQSPPLGFSSDPKTIIPLYMAFLYSLHDSIHIFGAVSQKQNVSYLVIRGTNAYRVVITVSEIRSVASIMYFMYV